MRQIQKARFFIVKLGVEGVIADPFKLHQTQYLKNLISKNSAKM